MNDKIKLGDLSKSALFAKKADTGVTFRSSIPEITIHVSGGVVSSVTSNGAARVLVYDFNNIEDEDDCEARIFEFGEGGKAK